MTANPSAPRVLINTADPSDAALCGFDSPADPLAGDDGLRVDLFPGDISTPPCLRIIDRDGQATVWSHGAIRQLRDACARAVAILNHTQRLRNAD